MTASRGLSFGPLPSRNIRTALLLGAVRLLGNRASGEAADSANRSRLRARRGRPETGIYELLTIMGSPSGTREHIEAGTPLPPAPRGWTWRLVRQGLAVGDVD